MTSDLGILHETGFSFYKHLVFFFNEETNTLSHDIACTLWTGKTLCWRPGGTTAGSLMTPFSGCFHPAWLPLTCPEGKPHGGWGLRPRSLTGETTLAQCLAVVQKLIVLRRETDMVFGEVPGGANPKDFSGQQLQWKLEDGRERVPGSAQDHPRAHRLPGPPPRLSRYEPPK